MSNSFIGLLWPSAFNLNKSCSIDAIISKYVSVRSKQIIKLSSFRALKNFIYQIYYAESWVGNFENHFCGVNGKTGYCYDEQLSLTVYIMTADSIEAINQMKKEVRTYCGIEKHSFHTTDTDVEFQYAYNLCMNDFSISIINSTSLYMDKSFYSQIYDYYTNILHNQINVEDMIIINNVLEWNNQVLRYCSISDLPILNNEGAFGWYLGVKIISPYGLKVIGE